MSIFEIIQDNHDGTYTLWGTFDHHSLIGAIPYFMKTNDPESFMVKRVQDSKALPLDKLYYFFKTKGKYD